VVKRTDSDDGSENSLERVLTEVRAVLGPPPPMPHPPFDLVDEENTGWGAFDLPAEVGDHPPLKAEPFPSQPTDVGVWQAVCSLKMLFTLVPFATDGQTRIGQCVAKMVGVNEGERFGGSPTAASGPFPDAPFPVRPITTPMIELNQVVAAAKPVILDLLDQVELDAKRRETLRRELQKSTPFLEEDDRGTLEGYVRRVEANKPPNGSSEGPPHPLPATQAQLRNDSKLTALADFLAGVRRQPEVVLHAAERILTAVRGVLEGWEFGVREGWIAHRGKRWPGLPPEAVLFMKMVVEAAPRPVRFEDLPGHAMRDGVAVSATKLEQVKKQLPAELRKLLQSGRGKGTWLRA
jgi:hypothetical protein